MTAAALAIVLSLVGSALLAATTSALNLADPEAMGSTKADRLARRLLRNREVNLAAGQLGVWILMVASGALWTEIAVRWLNGRGGITLVALVALVVLCLIIAYALFGYQLPQRWASSNPERALRITAPLGGPAIALLRPAISISDRVIEVILPILPGGKPEARTPYMQLRQLLARSSLQLGLEETSMLAGVLDLSSRTASQIMTPTPAVATIPESATVTEAARKCVESGHTRLLVVTEGSTDGVCGLVHATMLLAALLDGRDQEPLESLVGAALIVPENKTLDQLLLYLQHRHQYMAVAVDEYGRVAGIVSIEDIMEEIVGEIEDESDLQMDALKHLPDGETLASGYMAIGDLERHGINLPGRKGVHSLGGYVFAELGRLPKREDSVEAGQYLLTVTEMDGARVAWVKITDRQ